ncbi:MAG TPA: DinB family protein [Ktedonobacteraceae bacterium]
MSSVATATQIATYETAPARLTMALEGLNDTQMRFTPGEQEWSIHNIVIHLADAELVGSWRLRKTLAEAPTTLQNYDEASWAQQLLYEGQRRDHALALFTMLRTTNAALFRLLPAEAWERTAQHETRGEMSVYDLFLSLFNHVDEHIQQIERLKQHFLYV